MKLIWKPSGCGDECAKSVYLCWRKEVLQSCNYDKLSEMASGSSVRFNELSQNIKDAEKRLGEIAVLRTHIINYAKTRDVYVAYRKSGYSKKFYEAHREEITLHKNPCFSFVIIRG